jgi:hypothetical protein
MTKPHESKAKRVSVSKAAVGLPCVLDIGGGIIFTVHPERLPRSAAVHAGDNPTV